MTLDPESVRIVLDLAHAELERMQLERPECDGGIGRMAFDDVAAAVEWTWYPPGSDQPLARNPTGG